MSPIQPLLGILRTFRLRVKIVNSRWSSMLDSPSRRPCCFLGCTCTAQEVPAIARALRHASKCLLLGGPPTPRAHRFGWIQACRWLVGSLPGPGRWRGLVRAWARPADLAMQDVRRFMYWDPPPLLQDQDSSKRNPSPSIVGSPPPIETRERCGCRFFVECRCVAASLTRRGARSMPTPLPSTTATWYNSYNETLPSPPDIDPIECPFFSLLPTSTCMVAVLAL